LQLHGDEGHGSATSVLTSTGGPLEDATAMVTSRPILVGGAWAGK